MKTIPIDAETRAAAFRTSVVRREHPGRGCARLRLSWRDCRGEKILQGLLVLAAVAGIGYGCSCLVDLVQSCALFAAEVGRSIQ